MIGNIYVTILFYALCVLIFVADVSIAMSYLIFRYTILDFAQTRTMKKNVSLDDAMTAVLHSDFPFATYRDARRNITIIWHNDGFLMEISNLPHRATEQSMFSNQAERDLVLLLEYLVPINQGWSYSLYKYPRLVHFFKGIPRTTAFLRKLYINLAPTAFLLTTIGSLTGILYGFNVFILKQ